MKKIKLLSLLLILPLIGGCGNQGKQKDTSGDYYDITDYGAVQFNEKDYICINGHYGEFFTDINIGRKLANDSTYLFSYESSNTSDPSFDVIISNPNLATFAKVEGSQTNFTIKTANAIGDFILKIEDARGELVYRNVVHVARSYTSDYMPQRLYNIDYFQSQRELVQYIGDWRLSFTDFKEGLVGVLTGGDDQEQNLSITFSATFKEYASFADGYNFEIKTIKSNANNTDITSFIITRCSDVLYMYTEEGLLAMLNASN